MRNRIGLLVPAAAVAAAVLVGMAIGAAGGSAFVATTGAAAVLLLGGLQVLLVQHLRRVRRRLDRIEQALAGRGHPAARASAGSSAATAAADISATGWVGGVPLPPVHLRFMNEDDAQFLATADELAGLLATHGLTPDSAVLDPGCGYGRLAVGLLRRKEFNGTYLGFDILPRHIAWCNGTLGKVNPRYRFTHVDLRNDRYNPDGALDADVAAFPAGDGAYDMCALFSVFTHLFEPTCRHYLDEIARTLRPGGVAVTTWLIFDEERLADVTAATAAYPLRLEHADGSRFMLAEDPLRAIGFHRDTVIAMAGKAGLDVRTIELGRWAGGTHASARQFQDLVVLHKP